MKQLISEEVIDGWKWRDLNPLYHNCISWVTRIILAKNIEYFHQEFTILPLVV